MFGVMLTLILVAFIFIVILTILYHLKIRITKFLFIIFIIFLISSFIVVITKDIDVTEKGWMTGFAVSYFDWARQVGNNVGEITGEIIRQDWSPN